jgi:hypothetical protein
MKQLLILVTTLVTLTATGQNTNATQKILVGFNFSPDYSFRTLKNNDGSPSSDLVIKSRNGYEVAKTGYTTGLHVCFNLSQLTGLETGIQFSNNGYKTKTQDLTYFPPSPGSPTKSKTSYAYQYIGIPLKAKFSFGKSKVCFVTGLGFTTSILLAVKQHTRFEYADGRTEKKTQSATAGFKKVNILPMISVGIDYKLNNKIHMLAEPTCRYGVVKTKDTPVTENLWNAGLNIGFYYEIK